MNPILRNILAVVLGWAIGSTINMGLVTLGHTVFPIPGINPEDINALAEIMPTLSPEYFVFPFLAHALGTLIGAAAATKIAVSHQMIFATSIGGLFFVGGVMVSFMIPAPVWFTILDLGVAYIPMAWFGHKLANEFQ